MMDIPPPHNANGYSWHHSDCLLKDVILSGPGELSEWMRRMMGTPEETPRMRAFKSRLSDDEVESILACTKTWWAPEQREWQATVTENQCGEGQDGDALNGS